MRPVQKKMLIIGIPVFVLLAAITMFMLSPRGKAESASQGTTGEMVVGIATLHHQATAVTEDVPGTIVAIQQVSIAPKVMSRIDAVYVHEGDHVAKGQLLARLEGKDLAVNVLAAVAALGEARAQLAKARQGPRPEQIAQADEAVQRAKAAYEQAAAQLDLVKTGARSQQKLQAEQGVLVAQQQVAQAEAGLATAQANLSSAQADYERMNTLFTEDIIPKQRLEHSATQLEADRQAVHQAEAAVNQARAGVEIAKAQASQLDEGARTQEIIEAEKQVEQAHAAFQQAQQDAIMAHQGGRREDLALASAGMAQAQAGLAGAQTMAGYTAIYAPCSGVITARKADPGSMAMPQQPLLTMDDDSLYQIVSQVPEHLATQLTRGARVMVQVDALQSSLPATIVEIVPGTDPASRTLTVKANLPHAAGMQSGLFGRLTITTGSESALSVPAGAVLDRHGLTGVYVVDEAGIARFTLVTLGKQVADRVLVLSGLEDGQRVVTSQVDHLNAGQRVRAEGGAL